MRMLWFVKFRKLFELLVYTQNTQLCTWMTTLILWITNVPKLEHIFTTRVIYPDFSDSVCLRKFIWQKGSKCNSCCRGHQIHTSCKKPHKEAKHSYCVIAGEAERCSDPVQAPSDTDLACSTRYADALFTREGALCGAGPLRSDATQAARTCRNVDKSSATDRHVNFLTYSQQ